METYLKKTTIERVFVCCKSDYI